ncbi:MAG: hypothetical protein ACYT04_52680, partial [Nostoc sp.]
SWIEKIERRVASQLVPILRDNNLLLPNNIYTNQEINSNFTMTKISNFNSLIALSQEYNTPVYALTLKQLNQKGKVLDNNQAKQEEFKKTFSDLADKIIALSSSYAVSA